MTCRIIDLSLSGAAIAAENRPPLKSLVMLGKVQSRGGAKPRRRLRARVRPRASRPRRSKTRLPRGKAPAAETPLISEPQRRYPRCRMPPLPHLTGRQCSVNAAGLAAHYPAAAQRLRALMHKI